MYYNRFLDRADQYFDSEIELAQIFSDATPLDSEDVAIALEDIAGRRQRAQSPISISELASSIESLLEDELILDTGIEVCLESLMRTGLSEQEARAQLLGELGVPFAQKNLASLIGTRLEWGSRIREHIDPPADKLPRGFGPMLDDDQPRYELRRILGTGAQGTVYEARDRVFEEKGYASLIAIKIIHMGASSERGRLEAVRARQLRHRHITRVFDMGCTSDQLLYITQELVEGVSLDTWIREHTGPLDELDAIRLVHKIAEAMEHAHAHGIVHRDLKPGNILIDRDREPMITDFGVAHANYSGMGARDPDGTPGSLAFMAPEQAKVRSSEGLPLLDVYAIAGLLFWLLTDRYPNGDNAKQAQAWLDEPTSGGPGRIELRYSRRLRAVIARGLDPDTDRRYQSVSAMRRDLSCLIEKRPIDWLDTTPAHALALATRRHPVLASAVLLGVVLLFAGGWFWSEQRNQGRLEQLRLQVEHERERVEFVQDRAAMIQTMVKAWLGAETAPGDPSQATTNLLFMHTTTSLGLLEDDPEFASDLFARQSDSAERYLGSLDPSKTSPIELALWHELIGVWKMQSDPVGAADHFRDATVLVRKSAPRDELWIDRLELRIALAGGGAGDTLRTTGAVRP